MTNLEAVKKAVSITYTFEDDVYLKTMIDNDVDPVAVYSKEHTKAVDLCAAAFILTLLSSADIQEGGFRLSISNRESLLNTRKALLAKYAIPDNTGPTVSGAPTYQW